MRFSFFFLFAIVAACMSAVNAFQCYYCLKEKCNDPQDSWQKISCNSPAQADKESVCAEIKYTDKTTQKEWTKRSCEIVNKGDVDKCVVSNAENVTCKTCTTDLCNGNSATNIYLSGVAIMGMIVAFLVPKFLM